MSPVWFVNYVPGLDQNLAPQRKLWVQVGNERAPEGRKNSCDTDSVGTAETSGNQCDSEDVNRANLSHKWFREGHGFSCAARSQ